MRKQGSVLGCAGSKVGAVRSPLRGINGGGLAIVGVGGINGDAVPRRFGVGDGGEWVLDGKEWKDCEGLGRSANEYNGESGGEGS